MMIPVSGAELAVEQREGGAPALLFIHGFPLDHTLWRHQLDGLTAWRRIAPDLRGAGASSVPASPAEYSTARYADDLVEMLDFLKVKEVVACGLSMGGYTLFELLTRDPRRIRAAVLSNTRAEADTPETRTARDALAGLAREQGSVAVAEKQLPKMLSPATLAGRPEVVKEARDMMMRAPAAGVIGALRALRDRPDHTATLPGIGVPVLVVAGADDQNTTADEMEQMAGVIPDARFTKIAGAGHLTPLEQPAAFNAALSDFLRTLG